MPLSSDGSSNSFKPPRQPSIELSAPFTFQVAKLFHLVQAESEVLYAVGGRAITLAHHAQRLAREALFLLVQGQTADIRVGHLRRLGATDT